MTDTSKIIIKPMPLRQVGSLQRSFAAAVWTSFTYFDAEMKSRTIREHSRTKLLVARLHPKRVVLVALLGDDIIGYAIGSVPKGGAGQLYWLYVSPSDRGNNTGLALLSRLLRLERSLGATSVTLATYDHRNYYERQGFKYIETKPVDGVMMDIMRYPLA